MCPVCVFYPEMAGSVWWLPRKKGVRWSRTQNLEMWELLQVTRSIPQRVWNAAWFFRRRGLLGWFVFLISCGHLLPILACRRDTWCCPLLWIWFFHKWHPSNGQQSDTALPRYVCWASLPNGIKAQFSVSLWQILGILFQKKSEFYSPLGRSGCISGGEA